jgi:hypothetical protein
MEEEEVAPKRRGRQPKQVVVEPEPETELAEDDPELEALAVELVIDMLNRVPGGTNIALHVERLLK